MIGSIQSIAYTEDKSKRPSPAKTVETKFGGSMNSINCSGPFVKVRVWFFSSLTHL